MPDPEPMEVAPADAVLTEPRAVVIDPNVPPPKLDLVAVLREIADAINSLGATQVVTDRRLSALETHLAGKSDHGYVPPT